MKIEKLWSLYDQWIAEDYEISDLIQLSTLIKELEIEKTREFIEKNPLTYLTRPKKEWSKIVGWLVLRNQEFYNRPEYSYHLYKGDVLTTYRGDVYTLTRTPIDERKSGMILSPGKKVTWDMVKEDFDDVDSMDCKKALIYNPVADQIGLYLPLYRPYDVKMLAEKYFAQAQKNVITHLDEVCGHSTIKIMLAN